MTMAFVRRLWPAWAPFANEAAYRAWLTCEGTTYRGAERVFTFCNATRQSVIEDYGVPAERVVTVGAAGHYTQAGPSRGYGSREIVFNGSDFIRKGGDVALGAFAIVRREFPDATLAIAGSKPLAAAPGVTWLGNVTRDELFARFDRADIVLGPARLDVMPGFTLEAMSRGAVPVVSDCPSMAELVEGGRDGLVASPCTVETVAARVIAGLRDPQGLRSMGDAARERVARDWNWDAVAGRIVAGLENRRR